MKELITTFFIIAAAELGDKTQLLTFGFAASYPLWEVMAAVFSASAVLMGVAVAFGGWINYFIPAFYVKLFAGLGFIAFGVWNWFGERDEKEEIKQPAGSSFWIVFSAFLLAELGDKTQLATFALAADFKAPILVWLGAVAGMVLMNLLGAVAGKWIGKVLPEIWLRLIGSAVFLAMGALTLIELLVKSF